MKKLLIASLILLPGLVLAQEELQVEEVSPCVQNIEVAQQRYDEGRIQDIQPLLKDCLERNEYDKAQKSQALRLLTLAYIFLDDEEMAEATMLELLHANHEFQVDPSIDPTEFINLHEQFRYKPLFNIGFKYSFNQAQPVVTGINNSLNMNGYRHTYNPELAIVGLGVNFEYEFAKNFVLYPELQFKTLILTSTTFQDGILGNPEAIEITNYEEHSWLSIPVSVKYNINFPKKPNIKLYVNLGGSFEYLLIANRSAEENVLKLKDAPDVKGLIEGADDKNKVNFAAIGGLGFTYKLGEGFIYLEGRYTYALTQFTNAANVLNPVDPFQLNTGVQDDLYRLNSITVSIGYTLNIYIPKQLR
jgi:hypothetical protein